MAEYQTPKDRAYTESLISSARKEATAFLNLKHAAERKDGVIPGKYRELMSIAVALTTHCAYCIEAHIKTQLRQERLAKRSRKPSSLRRRFVQAVRLG